MAGRVVAAARRAAVPEAGIHSLEQALEIAMRPREERLPDDHHPDFLHPGRTVLILLEDLGITDAAILSAGALAETLRPTLAADLGPEELDRIAPGTPEILAQLPIPRREGDRLLEALVAAPEPVRRVALAERLDHVRRLHLQPREEWAALHAETRDCYLPVAARTHPTLERRLRWWCTTFEARFLGGHDPEPAARAGGPHVGADVEADAEADVGHDPGQDPYPDTGSPGGGR